MCKCALGSDRLVPTAVKSEPAKPPKAKVVPRAKDHGSVASVPIKSESASIKAEMGSGIATAIAGTTVVPTIAAAHGPRVVPPLFPCPIVPKAVVVPAKFPLPVFEAAPDVNTENSFFAMPAVPSASQQRILPLNNEGCVVKRAPIATRKAVGAAMHAIIETAPWNRRVSRRMELLD